MFKYNGPISRPCGTPSHTIQAILHESLGLFLHFVSFASIEKYSYYGLFKHCAKIITHIAHDPIIGLELVVRADQLGVKGDILALRATDVC